MGEALARVSKGQRLSIAADAWNILLDIAKRGKGSALGDQGAGDVSLGAPASLSVLVRNDSGANRSRGDILAVGDPLTDAEGAPLVFEQQPAFAGDAPAASDDAVVILAEPIASGAIGRGVIVGSVVVSVSVTDVTHGYASPVAGQTGYLASASYGAARLLWRATGSTGNQYCVVWIAGTYNGATPGLPAASYIDYGYVSLSDQQLGRGYKSVKGLVLDEGDLTDTFRPTIFPITFGVDSTFAPYVGLLAGNWDFRDGGKASIAYAPLVSLLYVPCRSERADTLETATSAIGYLFESADPGGNAFLYIRAQSGPGNTAGLDTIALSLRKYLTDPGSYGGGADDDTVVVDTPGVIYAGHGFATSGGIGESGTTGGLTFAKGLYVGGTFSGAFAVDGGTTGFSFSGAGTEADPATLEGTLGTGNGGTGLTTTPPAGSMLVGTGSGYAQSSITAQLMKWGA